MPTDLIHSGEHFINVAEFFLRVHQKNMSTVELPWTQLFNMIVDGHWERPKKLAEYKRQRKSLEKK